MSGHSMEQFWRACEAAGPLVTNLSASHLPGTIQRTFDQPFLVVGSHPDSDLVLAHPEVSPRQCYLQALGDKVLCVDLSSRTGTRRDNGVVGSGWLEPLEPVRIGPFTLAVRSGGRAPLGGQLAEIGQLPAHPLESPSLSGSLPRLSLEFRHDRLRNFWRMKSLVTLVGNAPDCRVRLTSPEVSRFHCALIRTGQGVWVVDLLGKLETPGLQGVVVEGVPSRYARLVEGDRMQVGPFQIYPRYEDLPAAALSRAESIGSRPTTQQAAGNSPVLNLIVSILLKHLHVPDDGTANDFQASLAEAAHLLRGVRRAQVEPIRAELERLRRLADDLAREDTDAPATALNADEHAEAEWSDSSTPESFRPQPLGKASRRESEPSHPLNRPGFGLSAGSPTWQPGADQALVPDDETLQDLLSMLAKSFPIDQKRG